MLLLTLLVAVPNIARAALSDHTVQGVSPSGTTINLFDYWNTTDPFGENDDDTDLGINAYHQLHFNGGASSSATGNAALNTWTGANNGPLQGMVSSTLVNGYPSLQATTLSNPALDGTYTVQEESLAYLFNANDYESAENAVEGKKAYLDVDGLLQVDSNGYYYYNASSAVTETAGGNFASANFAEFDAASNSFTLYDTWGVNKTSNQSPNGQFFPFNTGNQVLTDQGGTLQANNLRSDDGVLNHYFGMSMTTRFVQENGGTSNNEPVTYEFSGDDDVWIYIDDVLVGDLGGIHDAASIVIDFSTGDVVVKNIAGDEVQSTDLRALFDEAGVTAEWGEGDKANTFADDTYHTLNFFYLERGNNDSNMSLRFNLVTIPETDIVKVDQDSNPVAGAVFELRGTNTEGEVVTISSGTTDEDGYLLLTDDTGYPVTIQSLVEQGYTDLVLEETKTPDGYRSSGESPLYIDNGLLLSEDPFTTGTYAQAKVTTTIPKTVTSYDTPEDTFDVADGLVFAVVFKNTGEDAEGEANWVPVSGNAIDGWTVADDHNWSSIIAAAQPNVATLAKSGNYELTTENLPGDIKKYYYYLQQNGGDTSTAEYTVNYYYTTANTVAAASESNTYRLDTTPDVTGTSDAWQRVFSARLFVSDTVNNLLVQKVDEEGNPVDGAEFSLYAAENVTIDETGKATVNDNTEPVATTTTATGTIAGSVTELQGTGLFSHLSTGNYYLIETKAPDGYVIDEGAVQVVVDSTGVYADAGKADDGVSVTRSVGKVIGSMQQFATDDDVDATLHDIKAALVTGTYSDDGGFNWGDANWDGSEDGNTDTVMHLSYIDPGDDAGYSVWDYASSVGGAVSMTVDEGWSKLSIRQCLGHTGTATLAASAKQELGDTDITTLFSGAVTVQVTNDRVASLEVSKTVITKNGVSAPSDASFGYTLNLYQSAEENAAVLAGEFDAQVYDEEGLPVGESFVVSNRSSTFTLEDGETLRVSDLPTGTGYTVTENTSYDEQEGENAPVSMPAGFSLDSITVNDGTDGVSLESGSATGSIVANDDNTPGAVVAFTNTYAASDTASLEVTKILVGRDWLENDSFSFNISTADDTTATAVEEGLVVLPETTSLTIASDTPDHKGAFGDIEFNAVGEYAFEITEMVPDDAINDEVNEGATKYSDATEEQKMMSGWTFEGITYDSSVKTVTVAVTDNEDGTLGAEVTEGANPTFENEYKSAPAVVEDGTDAAFSLTKQLTGREGNVWLDGDSFEFTLASTGDNADETPMPADSVDDTKTVVVTKNDVTDAANGIASIDFGPIEYETAGTYTYTVTETNAGETIDGVTYANNTVEITVTVTDNGVGGLVAAVAKTGESTTASFVNTYSSTVAYNANGVGGLDVTKVLGNRDMTAGQFTFTVTADGAALEKIGGTSATMSSAAADADIAASVTGNPFDNITFDRDDSDEDFVYVIVEDQESGNGYVCDSSTYTVTITPHDNGDGTMSVTTVVEDSDGDHSTTVENATVDDPQRAVVPFDNTYEADSVILGAQGDATIVAHKTLKNDNIANYVDVFDFVVTSGDVTVATGTNTTDGTVIFDDIEYTSDNLYAAAHGGSDEVGTATIETTDEGDVVYTFNYAVTENATDLPEGVSYESGNGTVTVTVTDNLTGELSIDVSYDTDGEGLEFVNVYGAGEEAQLVLTGTKSIVGADGTNPPILESGMFGFTITGSDGAPMPDVTYVENAGATVEFGPIVYTMENVFGMTTVVDEPSEDEGIEVLTAGRTKVFTYTIAEDASKTVPGVTNDTTTKTVEVTVTDMGDGTLTAAVTKVAEGTAENMSFSFVNEYSADPIEESPTGEGGLTVTKVWDRQGGTRELAAGDFSFVMIDSEGNVVSEGTNDADGAVSMSPVKYEAEGQYVYTLKEVVPNEALLGDAGYEKDGVLYSGNMYTVYADVVDDQKGTFDVTWTMTAADGTPVDVAEFVNVYSVDPVSVTFGAAKSLDGRAVEAGEFSFELKDAEGNVIGTATNGENGSIVFSDAIQTFGAAGEYYFTVSEVLPVDDDPTTEGVQKDGVTYDETVYTVHLVIADDEEGHLYVNELVYNDVAELPVFTNSYEEPAAAASPIEPIREFLAKTGDFAGGIIAAVVAVIAIAAGGATYAVRKMRRPHGRHVR